MRTKTLLMAVAALAAGLSISKAQVYSANVVGYASVPTLNSGQYYMLAVPFSIGVSNGANEVFGNTLPAGSTVYTWNVNQFVATIYDNTDPNGVGPGAPVWYQSDDSTPAIIPTLPVGQGFFLVPNGAVTNVFAGAIPVNVGTSNKMSLPNSGQYYMVASVVPYAGAVTNGNNSTGGANLNNLPAGSTIYTWNVNTYQATIYDNTDPNGVGPGAPVWYQSDDSTPAPVPTLTVGQGFFVVPNGPYTWTTGL